MVTAILKAAGALQLELLACQVSMLSAAN